MGRLGAVEGAFEGGGAGAGGFCANAAGTGSPIVRASPTKVRK
jgi:hypothetical protein